MIGGDTYLRPSNWNVTEYAHGVVKEQWVPIACIISTDRYVLAQSTLLLRVLPHIRVCSCCQDQPNLLLCILEAVDVLPGHLCGEHHQVVYVHGDHMCTTSLVVPVLAVCVAFRLATSLLTPPPPSPSLPSSRHGTPLTALASARCSSLVSLRLFYTAFLLSPPCDQFRLWCFPRLCKSQMGHGTRVYFLRTYGIVLFRLGAFLHLDPLFAHSF